MKRFRLLRFAGASLALLALAMMARADERPHYGGTMRIELHEAVGKLDPANENTPPLLVYLVFDTLVSTDANGKLAPGLATEWHSEDDDKRWRFVVRSNVRFHDGAPLTAALIAQQLAARNPLWRVTASQQGKSLLIETDASSPCLPEELAFSRNAISHTMGERMSGTGPFMVSQTLPNAIKLDANDDYWGGRPYLDSAEILPRRSFRDQRLDLDTAHADVIEAPAEQQHRAQQEHLALLTSSPAELIAIQFDPVSVAGKNERVRQLLSLSIDRASIASVLTLKIGEAAPALLPDWMTGYGFLFPSHEQQADRVRQLRLELKTTAPIMLGFPADDPLARLIAERVALNARDAGLQVRSSALA